MFSEAQRCVCTVKLLWVLKEFLLYLCENSERYLLNFFPPKMRMRGFTQQWLDARMSLMKYTIFQSSPISQAINAGTSKLFKMTRKRKMLNGAQQIKKPTTTQKKVHTALCLFLLWLVRMANPIRA